MLIFGTRRTVRQLAIIMLNCASCGNPAAHSLLRLVTKFTLFFVPLFPVRTRYQVECTFCGATGQVTKEEAQRLQAAPQQPGQGQWGGQPRQGGLGAQQPGVR